MKDRLKLLLLALMALGLLFGFIHARAGSGPLNFERLHVFLFNLCAGGFLTIYFSEGRAVTARSALFLAMAAVFALSASLEVYSVAITAALLLALIVERVRTRRFPLFPVDFFRSTVSVSDKFHHAALVCLSLGLILSAAMMIIKVYARLPLPPKMGLDIFFLGFSFPVSLITMSVMFSFMKSPVSRATRFFHGLSFWVVNAGVIVFFIFILAEWSIAQVIISIILSAAVVLIYVLFIRGAHDLQQKTFLVSGMALLMMTAVTGVGYIVARHLEDPGTARAVSGFVLALHGYVSLFGWNQVGLFVIVRFDDFPLRLNSALFIALHWATVAVLAPLGDLYLPAGVAATVLYGVILWMAFFTRGRADGGTGGR
jgi:hypothetical protein